jgi:hypothetical protein
MKTSNIKDWFSRIYPWAKGFKRLKKCKRNDGFVIRVYDAPGLPDCQSVVVVSEPSDRNSIYQIQALGHVPETPDLKSLTNWQDFLYIGLGRHRALPTTTKVPGTSAKYVFDVETFEFLGKKCVGVSVSDKAYFDKNGYQSDWHLSNSTFTGLGLGEEAEGFFSESDESLSVDDVRKKLNAHPAFLECPEYAKFMRGLKQ